MWGLLFLICFHHCSLSILQASCADKISRAGWWSFKLWCYRFTRAFLIPFSPWLNKQYGRYFQHKAPRRLIIAPWTYRKQDSNRPAQSPDLRLTAHLWDEMKQDERAARLSAGNVWFCRVSTDRGLHGRLPAPRWFCVRRIYVCEVDTERRSMKWFGCNLLLW